MSNARSPRDVCSTTIGTRGLIVLDSIEGEVRCSFWSHSDQKEQQTLRWFLGSVAGGPKLAGFRAFPTLRRQKLLPRLDLLFTSVGFLFGNRLRRLGHQLDRLLGPQVFAHH